MLTLVNPNRMRPPIAPIGLDYLAAAAEAAGIQTEVLDLCLVDDPQKAMADYFGAHSPTLVGVTLRNVDDCFWPNAQWFVPDHRKIVDDLRRLTDAPIVLGGVGYAIFPEHILRYTGADLGIRGDGEQALIQLYRAVEGRQNYQGIAGLLWRDGDTILANPPAWPDTLTLATRRDALDNRTYFRLGGQAGLETKRGCNRDCIYCAEHLAKGKMLRRRNPAEVADEAEYLLKKGVDVLHLCDSEFNIPRDHAAAVCDAFIRRKLADRLRWYAYLTTTPFDDALAAAMKAAGCAGINFTGDSGSPAMLKTYRQRHTPEDLARTVTACRKHGIEVMIDLMIGGPGETPETVARTIGFVKQIDPDCAGTALGIRIYPHTEIARIAAAEGPLETNPNIRRRYEGTVDLFQPTFYIAHALGDTPANLVRGLIAGDTRFFAPMPDLADAAQPASDHNYNDNTELANAIAEGARGAYWHILKSMKN
ncbi:MAG: radical SAM protein [Phycisphaerae bacterium]|nr:radical SAM protein [Phycisphaerae bacterium]